MFPVKRRSRTEVTDEQMREKMLASLKGKGAFRRFKDTVFYLGIRDDCFAYRDNRFRDIAERWCMDNKLL